MKNFVVGIANLFEGQIKLYKVEADDKYNAFKKAMLDSCLSDDSRKYELEWQNSDEYPQNYEELCNSEAYIDFPFDIVGIEQEY